MAGVNEQARRVRTKEALGPSVVRSAPVCSHVGSTTGVGRRPKATAKRAANDDGQRMASTVPTQQAKRRAALTNLTNQSNASSLHSGGASKARVTVSRYKAQAAAVESKPCEASQEASATLAIQTKSSQSLLVIHNDENLLPGSTASHVQAKVVSAESILGDAAAEAIAALEQETKHSLYISNDSRAPACKGTTFNDENQLGKHGCTSKSYMDIDSNHKDPQICSSYAMDIYQYLQISELKRRPNKDYMGTIQHDINDSMRGILVDWLVEVAEEYRLVPDTLYLTVAYIDRFLSARMVNRQRLQLLGVACMLIAAKYEEISAPQVEEFCYITDNTYSNDEVDERFCLVISSNDVFTDNPCPMCGRHWTGEISCPVHDGWVLDMERQVLNQLHFELTGPTTKTFLRRFLRAAQACQKSPTLHMEFLGNCLAELTLLEYDFLKYLPSMIAGSAVFLAKFTLEPNVRPWNTTLQHYTGYRPSELKDCVQAIHNLQHNVSNCTLPAIREKYRQHKFKCVATIASPAVIPFEYFEDLDG